MSSMDAIRGTGMYLQAIIIKTNRYCQYSSTEWSNRKFDSDIDITNSLTQIKSEHRNVMADILEYDWIVTCKTGENGIIGIHNVRYSEIIQYRWPHLNQMGAQ